MPPSPTQRRRARRDAALEWFPILLRYASFAMLVGMTGAWYVTDDLNATLLGAWLSLAASSEGVGFLRDVLVGRRPQQTKEQLRERLERERR